MKTRKRKFYSLITKIFLIGILLSISNCENQENLIKKENTFSVSEISVQDFFNDTNFIKFKNKLSSKESKKSNNIYDFSINYDVIKKVKVSENKKTYTLFISRKNKSNRFFENLVLIELNNVISEAFIVKYTPENIKYYTEHNSLSFDGKRQVTKLDIENININQPIAKSSECYQVYEVWCDWQFDHVASGTCYNNDHLYLKATTVECNFTEQDTHDYNTGGGTGGSGSPSGDGGDGGNDIPTSPIIPVSADGNVSNANILINDLVLTDFQQMIWVLDPANSLDVDNIYNFLESQNWSNEAKSFAKEAVNALVNNGEIDLDNRLIYNPIIAQDYKTKMSPAEVVIFETLNEATKLLYLKAATNAYIYAETHFPKPVRNTKGDTFKHTFWNAISTVYIGETLTKQLTDAHEEIAYDPNYSNHYKETQMDLYNNEQGRQIAYNSGRLYQLVQSALDNGSLRYLNNLVFTNGFWNATNSSVLTPTNQ